MRKTGTRRRCVLHKPGHSNSHRGMKRCRVHKLVGKCHVNHNESTLPPQPRREERSPIPGPRQDAARPLGNQKLLGNRGWRACVHTIQGMQAMPRWALGDMRCYSKGPNRSLFPGTLPRLGRRSHWHPNHQERRIIMLPDTRQVGGVLPCTHSSRSEIRVVGSQCRVAVTGCGWE